MIGWRTCVGCGLAEIPGKHVILSRPASNRFGARVRSASTTLAHDQSKAAAAVARIRLPAPMKRCWPRMVSTRGRALSAWKTARSPPLSQLRATMEMLIGLGASCPIVNENDTVRAHDEISLWRLMTGWPHRSP